VIPIDERATEDVGAGQEDLPASPYVGLFTQVVNADIFKFLHRQRA
jgi:hypothetical protein